MGMLLNIKIFIQTNKLKSSDERTRRAAIDSLTTIGKQAKRALITATVNNDWYVRRKAIHSLAELGLLTTEMKLMSLIEDLKDESSSIVSLATEELIKYGKEAQISIPLLIKNLKHKYRPVRFYSAFAIANICPDGQPLIANVVKFMSESIKVQDWADGYSIKIEPSSLNVVTKLIQALDNAPVDIYSLIIDTLGTIAYQYSSDPIVKEMILSILKREVGNEDNYIRELATHHLKDHKYYFRNPTKGL